ncbi:MAG TPA: hypothetical protein VKB78_17275, partial [Pirellulales bacterium]|nr:hypothetical protein [Pirellulales bacterium]
SDKAEKPEKPAAPVGEPLNPSYKELIPDPPTLRGWQHAMGREPSLYQSVNQMVLGNTPIDNNEFDKFFTKQVFPQFTLYKVSPDVSAKGQTNVIVIDPENEKDDLFQKSRLPMMRDVFTKRFLAPINEETMFTRLSDLTVTAMREIALGNYHPLSRFNAVLLLGSLHEFKNSSAPYAKAWPVFVECLDSTAVVKDGAMTLILRNAKAGAVPADLQAKIIEKLDKIATDKTVAKGESPEAHDFIRRKAIETLVALGDAGLNEKVAAELAAIVNDPQSSIRLACGATKALGNVKTNLLGALDLSALSASIGRIAVAATRAELDQAELLAFGAPLPPIGGNDAGIGPRGARGAAAPAAGAAAADQPAPAPAEQYINVPMLKDELGALIAGLGTTDRGIKPASNGTNHAQNVARIEAALTELMTACTSSAADYDALKRQLEKSCDALETKGGAAPAKTAGGKAGAVGDAFDAIDKATPAKDAKTPAGK